MYADDRRARIDARDLKVHAEAVVVAAAEASPLVRRAQHVLPLGGIFRGEFHEAATVARNDVNNPDSFGVYV